MGEDKIEREEIASRGKKPDSEAVERVTRMGNASIPKLIVEFAVPSVVGMVVNG